MEQKLYGAALFLNPGKYFFIKEESDLAYRLRINFNDVLSKTVPDQVLVDKISDLADVYNSSRDDFVKDMAIRQRKSKNPIDWWNAFGGCAIELAKFAKRILGLCCSSSGCERNWSTFEFNRLRNPSMTGYSQQGYQARPPTSWAPPGQQQSGYGYIQPGVYPGQTPQYNMSQPQYPGYPPQPTSGGYGTTGWDQTTGATNQQTTQGGGYDYYSHQSAPQQQQAPGGASGPTDNSAYGYNQQPASGYNQQGQGYTQDGYGGYHASAPQPGYGPPQPGYDQQQGYNSTAGYGTVANPTPEGQTPSYGAQGDGSQALPSTLGQQGYNISQQPSPNPSYPPQGPTQPGYGVPPPTSQTAYGTQQPTGYGPSYAAPQAQKPAAGQAAYGQPQQSPTAQGGYVQPSAVQASYPHSQPTQAQASYAQPDSAAQRAPPSAYGTAQASGYAPPPYGAAPATQPSYGGQQQPPYNSSYASGYSQPAAYSADGSAAPASQAVPPSGVAKASPQS